MRVLALVAALVMAPFAYGNVMLDNVGSYTGSGEWKSADGDTGTFTITSSSTVSQDGEDTVIKLQSNLSIYQDGALLHEEQGTTELVLKEHDFFDVRRDGEIVGSGYCYGTVCHHEMIVDGMASEETIKFAKGKMYYVGSFEHGKMKGAYRGISTKSKSDK